MAEEAGDIVELAQRMLAMCDVVDGDLAQCMIAASMVVGVCEAIIDESSMDMPSIEEGLEDARRAGRMLYADMAQVVVH